MRVHVVGCGESARTWGNWALSEEWDTIGVNDCFKWGRNPKTLFLVDPPDNFRNDPERLKIIKATIPEKVVSFGLSWKPFFKGIDYEHINSQPFTGKIVKGRQYHSQTSTFAAMSYALNKGATRIILHGVDLRTHEKFRPGIRAQELEIRQYGEFAAQAKLLGCEIGVISKESALIKVLPV